jgi:hypothetical protein
MLCPHCQGTGHLPTVNPVEQLREMCLERGMFVSHDGMVREADAAALMGLAPRTLTNWRANGRALPFVKRAGRPLYALTDVAAWIAENSFTELH